MLKNSRLIRGIFSKDANKQESVIKTQHKDINNFKQTISSQNNIIKNYEDEINGFKEKINKFNSDIEEFKKTNASLVEAQMKDVDLENRQNIK